MPFIKNLVRSLEGWEENIQSNSVTSLEEIVEAVLIQLGDESYTRSDYVGNSLKFLEEKLKQIIRGGIQPEFIVDSVIHFISKEFNNKIEKRTEHIDNNKLLWEKARSIGISEQEEYMKETKRKIQKLESKSYLELVKKEEETWLNIISRNFSEENKKAMNLDEISKNEVGMQPDELVSFQNIIRDMKV